MVRAFFFSLALLSAGLAARRFYIEHLFSSWSAKISAQILPGSVANSFTHSGTGYVTYAFTLPDGRTFRNAEGGYGGKPGDTILVEYVPTRPDFNRVAGSGAIKKRLVWIFAVPAAFFLLIAVRLKLPR